MLTGPFGFTAPTTTSNLSFYPAEDCWHVDEIPLDRLRGEGVLIDVSSYASWPENPDFRLTDEILRERVDHWEVAHGRPIPDGKLRLGKCNT